MRVYVRFVHMQSEKVGGGVRERDAGNNGETCEQIQTTYQCFELISVDWRHLVLLLSLLFLLLRSWCCLGCCPRP